MTTIANRQEGSLPVCQVPLLDLGRQHVPLADQIAAALGRVCQTGAFVLGPEVKDLEERIAAYCRTQHAVGCASGSDALLLALMALDVGPGDEVIFPVSPSSPRPAPSRVWAAPRSSPTSTRQPSTSIRPTSPGSSDPPPRP